MQQQNRIIPQIRSRPSCLHFLTCNFHLLRTGNEKIASKVITNVRLRDLSKSGRLPSQKVVQHWQPNSEWLRNVAASWAKWRIGLPCWKLRLRSCETSWRSTSQPGRECTLAPIPADNLRSSWGGSSGGVVLVGALPPWQCCLLQMLELGLRFQIHLAADDMLDILYLGNMMIVGDILILLQDPHIFQHWRLIRQQRVWCSQRLVSFSKWTHQPWIGAESSVSKPEDLFKMKSLPLR